MAIWTDIRNRWVRRNESTEVLVTESSSAGFDGPDDRMEVLYDVVNDLSERLLELDREDVGWLPVSEDRHDWSRNYIRRVIERSRNAYIYHPLINRSIEVKKLYVWGQGVTIKAANDDVNRVIQAFLDDPANKAELTSHQAQTQREVDLEADGNLFFALFSNPSTGHVRVRSIPVEEIDDIITNPEDRREVWFYKRTVDGRAFDITTGNYTNRRETLYYPDWRYNPEEGLPATIGGNRVERNVPVYHVKVGGLGGMKFGVPELYAALDWNTADTTFRQDFAAVARTLQRFASKLKVEKGGRAAVSAAKAKVSSTFATNGGASGETNPAPNAGAVFVAGSGTDLDPVKVSGATLNLGDVRYLMHMVCAAAGLPEYFYGNADVGNHATSKTLDRPTELNFQDRRMLWTSVFTDIFDYCIDESVLAPNGVLRSFGTEEEDEITGDVKVVMNDEDFDRSVAIDFPSILEHSITEQVDAIVKAATLGAQPPIGTMDDRTLVKLLLTSLNVPNVDDLLDDIAPQDGESLIAKMRAAAQEQSMAMQQARAPQQPTPSPEDEDEEPQNDEENTEDEEALRESLVELRGLLSVLADA